MVLYRWVCRCRSGKPAWRPCPARRGFFAAPPARAGATDCDTVSVGLPSRDWANPRKELSPASAGFFRASVSPLRAVQPTVRLGVGGAGLPLSLLAGTGGRPPQTVWTPTQPRSLAGLLFGHLPPSVGCPALTSGGRYARYWRASPGQAWRAGNALGESRWGLAGLCSPVLTKWLRLRPPGLRAGAPRLSAHAVGSGAVSQPTSATRPTPLGTGAGPCGEIFAVRGPL